jgi:hypothetical protein
MNVMKPNQGRDEVEHPPKIIELQQLRQRERHKFSQQASSMSFAETSLSVIPRPQKKRRTPTSPAEIIHATLNRPSYSTLASWIDCCTLFLIAVFCLSIILETLPEYQVYKDACKQCKPVLGSNQTEIDARVAVVSQCIDCAPKPHVVFVHVQYVCSAYFFAMFLCQLSTAFSTPCRAEIERSDSYVFPRYRRTKRTIYFLLRPTNTINCIACLADVVRISTAANVNISIVRITQLLRFLRIFNIRKYVATSRTIARVMRLSAMALVVHFAIMVMVILLTGSVIWVAERGAWDPATGLYLRERPVDGFKQATPFLSIPHTFWWSVNLFSRNNLYIFYFASH